ncbi:HlyD family secretion protein [Bernardetia sp.]|uniref:HlyD family secretion protein n=1 Tax=Bernardetia sp. TaxID=1937974 RepID=UPI0025BAD77C|nr:HlyD family efflux transporter periplasmic adaptor subunit [Bernardetia sp.]
MLGISKNRIPAGDRLFEDFYVFELLQTPRYGKIVAYWSLGIFIAGIAFLFLPWQQNIAGFGQLTALRPEDRPQKVYPVIGGRIEAWHVQEGQFVHAGDTIARISEIKDYYFDPNLTDRMVNQIDAQGQAINSLEAKAAALDQQIAADRAAMELEVNQAKNKVEQLRYKITIDSADLVAIETQYENAQRQYQREQELFERGLTSKTDLENKEIKAKEMTAKLNSAQNKLATTRNEYLNTVLQVSSKRAAYMSKISKAISDKSSTLAYVNENEQKLTKLENELTNVEVRQSNYIIRAPQSGYVVKSLLTGIGEIVKEGQALVTIMPEDPQLAVELYVSANDVPLLQRGTHVRLQFDGWPSLVFSGWESATVGTFGGKIAVIDYINTKNKYRVLVVPDTQGEEEWPAALRVGSGVYGWAMLNEVPIWYELWRQLNAFPPLPVEGSDYENKAEKDKVEQLEYDSKLKR